MPCRPDSAEDPRRAFAEELLNASGIVDMFQGVHHFDVNEPEEDLGLLRMGFAAWGATVWFDIPDFARWLARRDMSETYAFHRRALQNYTHQRQSGEAGQWVVEGTLSPLRVGSIDQGLSRCPFYSDPSRTLSVLGILV